MKEKKSSKSTENARVATKDQVSAGGVAFRHVGSEVQIAIVSVQPSLRWQLPKGLVDPGETTAVTAVREVREEAGIRTEAIELIETVQYWYQQVQYGQRIRYHKFVHFYLLRYLGGDVEDHDHEIAEARWVNSQEAIAMLAFESERGVVEKASGMIQHME